MGWLVARKSASSEISNTDEDLLIAYQQGSDRDFEKLYKRHKNSLMGYLYRQCHNQAHAEEMFQDVWLSVIRSRTTYKKKAKFKTWFYTIASNRLVDYYRKQGKEQTTFTQCSDFESVDYVNDPERNVFGQHKVQQLLGLLRSLPMEQMQVFLLKEEAGLSVNEIALVTSVSNETAKSRLRYAFNKLRAGLEDQS